MRTDTSTHAEGARVPQHVSVKTAAERLAVTPRFIYQLIERGDLPATKLGRRILIPVDRLRERLSATTAECP